MCYERCLQSLVWSPFWAAASFSLPFPCRQSISPFFSKPTSDSSPSHSHSYTQKHYKYINKIVINGALDVASFYTICTGFESTLVPGIFILTLIIKQK